MALVSRVGGPLDVLDRALLLARKGGWAFAWRPLAAGGLVAGAGLLVYYVERVEGIRSIRALLAFLLVLAWWGRAILMARAAGDATRMLWDGATIADGAGRPVDVIRTASVVGMGLWIWLWLLVGASVLGPMAVPLVLPVLALRGAVAPSWLARAGCTADGGLRAFARAAGDISGRRATTVSVELMVLLGAIGLAIDLFGAVAVFVLLARSFLGLDVTFIETFFSVRNVFLVLALGSVALVLLEPLRAAISAVVFVDARVRQEGLDLRALVDQAFEVGARRGGLPREAKRGASVAAAVLLAFAALSAPAEAQPPSAELVPLPPGTGPDGVAPPPDPDSWEPTGTGMPPKEPTSFDALLEGEPRPPARSTGEDERVREEVDAILAGSEFAEFEDERGRGVRDLIDRILAWLSRERVPDTTPQMGPKIPLPPAGFFLAIGAVLLLGVLLYAIATRSRDRKKADSPGASPEEASKADPRERAPAAHLDDAALLAQDGRFREALRALYLATLVALDRRRLIAFDPALTNWQYIRQMPRGDTRDWFARFTRLFDYKWYGDEPTNAEDYRSCRELAARIVAAEEKPAA